MKILIADDHDLIRDALSLLIQKDEPGSETLQASNVDEAIELVENNNDVDLVLLDVYMPGMNELAGLKALKERCPELPVVLMSGQMKAATVDLAFSLGAMGFIPKTLSGKALVSVLNMILSGVRYVPDLMLSTNEARVKKVNKLSPREMETLQQLSRGLSNKVIARAMGIEETTVKLHLRSLFRKLGAQNRTEAVLIAQKQGLL